MASTFGIWLDAVLTSDQISEGRCAMDTLGSFAAKTHLAELLDRVARGEVITITRRGHPVARLVPVSATSDEARYRRYIEELRHARAGQDRGARRGTRIAELIAKGRERG